MTTVTFTSSGSWTAPAGVSVVDCACWGESGSGANGVNGSHSGGGAGGGEFAEETALAVTPGSVYNFTIGTGGSNTATSFPGDSVTVTAHAGSSSVSQSGAVGGTGSTNTIHHDGGHGGNGASGTNKGGGGGGGSGGSGGAGGTGGTGTTAGGSAGTAGTGTNPGAAGGAGGGPTTVGSDGNVPGGAPGGGGNNGNRSGGNAVSGQIQLTYTAPVSGTATLTGVGTLTADGGIAGAATLTGIGTLTAARSGAGNATLTGIGTLTASATQGAGATLSGVGTLTAAGGLPAPAVVNQWATSFSQPATFGTTPPALQSLVVPLTLAYSVGGGSGTPTAGNWLFCLTAMNEQATTSGYTVGVGDDIHSFWRPGNESTSTWAVSTATALTRTSIWYTPNIARVPQDVYVAPNGAFDAMAVLVVEISGLGPWDTVTGINTNYSAAATTLALALGAPAASAFTIAAVGGDNTANGQAFAPGGWTALSTVTTSNGVDHTCDAELTSAFLPSTSGSISVSGSASSATDLSGAMVQVLVAASSPVPAAQNPNWPYLKFEAAFGGGFQTPPDQLTWTDLTSRCWAWDETTGIQYQLGQIQATHLEMELDNFDGNLSTDNASSPYYPHVVTGTPVRIRAALGTIGGVTVNRWYCITRNLQEIPQQITPEDYRRFSPATGTDIWSVLATAGSSPYRGEVEQDAPYAWWPMDDGLLAGGVQPTSLRNAATGNTAVLTIQPNPNGVTAGDQYTSDGIDATTTNIVPDTPPQVATYSVAQQAGWMYGDPQSSPQSYGTGNPVTPNPGSAAWQQAGGAGNSGNNAWFLTCNDSGFPGLSGGATFSLWFNATFLGTASGWKDIPANTYHSLAGQPYSVITLAELATASAPVMVLQLDINGHLNLVTYNGGTGTSHAIYSASDLRNSVFNQVTVTATTSNWTVYVNGGLTAQVSGSGAGMTSAWTWLIINADLGSAGGSSLSSAQHSGNVAYSQAEVFPRVLPAWRILARYCAAITAFGLLPAPQTLSLSAVCNQFGTGWTTDGTEFNGSYGKAGAAVATYTFSAVAVSQAGAYTSGPSSRSTIAGIGTDFSGTFDGNAIFVGFTALAPQVLIYTAASAYNETNASTVLGAGDTYTSGFGASASGHGVSHTAGGTGAAYPAAASALGDDVGQRLERILGYGNATYPGRCIDPAALPVQAATDIGGQQTGQNLMNIAQSDGGLLYVDNQGNLTYWQKSHLASQYSSPVWTLTPTAPPTPGAPLTAIPYYPQGYSWTADPQRVFNAVLIQPFSPDGASLADVTPSSASSVNTSQAQYGPQPRQITSYLQSTSEMQSQADWILSNYGVLQIRVQGVKVDAAPYPAAWQLVLGVNVGDVVTCSNWQIGGGGTTGTFRVSNIQRVITFGAGDPEDHPRAQVTLTLDYEPPSWWS